MWFYSKPARRRYTAAHHGGWARFISILKVDRTFANVSRASLGSPQTFVRPLITGMRGPGHTRNKDLGRCLQGV